MADWHLRRAGVGDAPALSLVAGATFLETFAGSGVIGHVGIAGLRGGLGVDLEGRGEVRGDNRREDCQPRADHFSLNV